MVDFTRGDVAHLLRRAGFSSTPAEIDAVAGEASWADVVDRVLDASGSPPDTIPAKVADPNAKQVEALVAAIGSWFDRMATTPTPIVEKVAFFWHGILTSSAPEVDVLLVFRQIQTWRKLGLGDIHALMQAMAIDPAMLDYLDNELNVKAAPNENFARELMELFTMGNGTFTEADVVAAGPGVDRPQPQPEHQRLPVPPRAARHRAEDPLRHHTRNWDRPREAITEILHGSQPAGERSLPRGADLVRLRLPRPNRWPARRAEHRSSPWTSTRPRSPADRLLAAGVPGHIHPHRAGAQPRRWSRSACGPPGCPSPPSSSSTCSSGWARCRCGRPTACRGGAGQGVDLHLGHGPRACWPPSS
ncbi:MAG: DUF1800 family protein [Acidimicrobiales bacterium]